MENGNGHPVTKSELQAILQAALSTQREDFHAALTAQKDELLETIRDVETHLLTGFHNCARDQQARIYSLEISDRDLVLRLAAIEDRLLALESKQPPSV